MGGAVSFRDGWPNHQFIAADIEMDPVTDRLRHAEIDQGVCRLIAVAGGQEGQVDFAEIALIVPGPYGDAGFQERRFAVLGDASGGVPQAPLQPGVAEKPRGVLVDSGELLAKS